MTKTRSQMKGRSLLPGRSFSSRRAAPKKTSPTKKIQKARTTKTTKALKTTKTLLARKTDEEKKKSRKSHLPYAVMARNSLQMSPRKPVSTPQMAKFVGAFYKLETVNERHLRRVLRKGVEQGTLKKVKQSYKLSSGKSDFGVPQRKAPSKALPSPSNQTPRKRKAVAPSKEDAPMAPTPSSSSSCLSSGEVVDRNRIQATRHDGRAEADMALAGVQKVVLKLGADKGILCGAALVYCGNKQFQKAVCITDTTYDKAITHSGDRTEGSRKTHTINIDLTAMPPNATKVYLTLCSCGSSNLSAFSRPSIEFRGDGAPMMRYDLSNAGAAMSTVMAVLEKSVNGSTCTWTASPVGSVSERKFCGNYGVATAIISELGRGRK